MLVKLQHAYLDTKTNKIVNQQEFIKDINLDARNPSDNDWKVFIDNVHILDSDDRIYHIESVDNRCYPIDENNILEYNGKLVKVLSYIIDGKPIPHEVPFLTRWMFVKSIDYTKKELYLSYK
jgi:hypothetical protein